MNSSDEPRKTPNSTEIAQKNDESDLLLEEYKLNLADHRVVWRTYVQTFVLVLTGILASVLAALWRGIPESRPFLAFVPLVISAWFMMIGLQNLELTGRGCYLAMLEARIRVLLRTESPCWENSFRSIIYCRWRWGVIAVLVGLPVLLLYGVCAWQGIKWLSNYWLVNYFSLKWYHFVLFYVFWALLPLWTFWSGHLRIIQEQGRVQKMWNV